MLAFVLLTYPRHIARKCVTPVEVFLRAPAAAASEPLLARAAGVATIKESPDFLTAVDGPDAARPEGEMSDRQAKSVEEGGRRRALLVDIRTYPAIPGRFGQPLAGCVSLRSGGNMATLVKISIPDRLAAELPTDPALQSEVLELGLRSLRIREALDVYRRGKGSLAFAAEQAGVTLREMIPLAYAHGLKPRVDPSLLEERLSIEQASEL